MKLVLLAVAASLVVLGTVGSADAGKRREKPVVTPRVGDGQTTFVIHYRAPRGLNRGPPDPDGRYHGDEKYVAHVRARCGDKPRDYPARQVARKRGQVIAFRLKAQGDRWCPGTYKGAIRRTYAYIEVEEDCSSTEQPDAGSTQCEEYRYRFRYHDRLVGFRFRVAR